MGQPIIPGFWSDTLKSQFLGDSPQPCTSERSINVSHVKGMKSGNDGPCHPKTKVLHIGCGEIR